MSMHSFLNDAEWDIPFFKKLASNDTGQAPGHQGGIVVPRDLWGFFPALDEAATSPLNPTTSRNLRVEMHAGTRYVAKAEVRYQFQTWGGRRPPEGRITGHLGPIRNIAQADDILLFQRRMDSLDIFRLTLIRKNDLDYQYFEALARNKRWGVLNSDDLPMSNSDLEVATADISGLVEHPFEIHNPDIERTESRQNRIARSAVFSGRVKAEYEYVCCISGIGIATPESLHEVEAAHVVPKEAGGTDDIRNGLSLCRTLHWAFDHGLLGIRDDRTIYIPESVRRTSDNSFILQYENRPIRTARTSGLEVHADALRWHMENRVRMWE